MKGVACCPEIYKGRDKKSRKRKPKTRLKR